jgi:uncharacterized protein (TIGR00730 family)
MRRERFVQGEGMAATMSIGLFCGSSDRASAAQQESARAFGAQLAARGHRLVYGGGRVGLMGLAADAALAGGAEVAGVIPRFIADHEVAHHGVTRLEVVDSMHERKARMSELADAFVVLGGGFGTLDELFEILTWKQLGLHDRAIVLVNVEGVFDPLVALVDRLVEAAFVRDSHRELYSVVGRVEDVWQALEQAPRTTGSIASKLG